MKYLKCSSGSCLIFLSCKVRIDLASYEFESV